MIIGSRNYNFTVFFCGKSLLLLYKGSVTINYHCAHRKLKLKEEFSWKNWIQLLM